MSKLTQVGVLALKPKDKVYERMDSVNPGFGVRVQPSGTKSFIYRFRINGRLRRLQLGEFKGDNLDTAFDDYRTARAKARSGIDPLQDKIEADRKKDHPKTFGNLAERYLEKYAAKKRTFKEDNRIINHDILPRWSKWEANKIKRRDVISLLDKIVERGAPIQANRTLALIRKIFNWALEKDLLESSPCAGIKAPSRERSKDRVLDDDEIRAFFALDSRNTETEGQIPCLSLKAISALKLQLLLAQRIGEVAGMRWDEINFQTKLWTLPASRSKNKIIHTIPLTDPCVGILEKLHILRDGDGPFVFSSRNGHIRTDTIATSLARALKARKLSTYSSHDLRRTAATRISGLRVSREVLRQILNHKDQSVTARYDRHRYDEEKRTALGAWGRELLRITEERDTAPNVVAIQRG